ncbi:MAG: hypothetical protein HIU91_02710 [Acidobacteria bacterium]|nr:hypothetical protein [Acidobacteriota bacterium]
MGTKLLLEYAMFGELLIGVCLFILMARKKLIRQFSVLAGFVAITCFEEVISAPILFFRKNLGISKVLGYDIYFYSHWILFFVESTLLVLVIYGVFRQAMKPLEGLHRAGKIVFRWIAGVAVALSIALAMGPHAVGPFYGAMLAGQMQQAINVLILCLLLFVCFSTRYLGLTYRSHIFGVSLGLGVFAVVGLIESAWISSTGAQSLYSPVYAVSAMGSCVALLVWGTYFAMPEPKRQMVLLPTTSPYFLWNAISEALGDEPGFVAIAGFTPDMLAPAELTVLTAASKWAKERDDAREREVSEEAEAWEAEAAMAKQQTLAYHSIAMPR